MITKRILKEHADNLEAILDAMAKARQVGNLDLAFDILQGYEMLDFGFPGVTVANVCSGEAVNLLPDGFTW